MIYEDVYRFLLNKASAKEFDIVLHLLLNTDWNSNVRIDPYQLGKQCKTTTKYVKEVFNKFLSLKKGKRILAQTIMNGEDEYTLLLGKSSLLYNPGERYCKKFTFLYSDVFKNLSIYSKRILLAAAMNVSNSNANETYINKDYFVYKDETSSGLIPNNKLLYRTIEEIHEHFNGHINVSLTSTTMKREEAVYVKFDHELLENVMHNNTEKRVLKETLFEYGFYKNLSDDHYIEIQKTGKYIFNSLFKYANEKQEEENIKGLGDQSLKLARNIYKEAVKRLAGFITTNDFENKDPKEFSAYFSTVAFEIVTEEMSKYKHHYESVKRLYERSAADHIEPDYLNVFKKRYTEYLALAQILEKWANTWVISRGSIEASDMKYKNDIILDRLTQLQHTTKQILDRVEYKIIKKSNNIFTLKEKTKAIRTFRAATDEYLSIQIERINDAIQNIFAS